MGRAKPMLARKINITRPQNSNACLVLCRAKASRRAMIRATTRATTRAMAVVALGASQAIICALSLRNLDVFKFEHLPLSCCLLPVLWTLKSFMIFHVSTEVRGIGILHGTSSNISNCKKQSCILSKFMAMVQSSSSLLVP